MNGYAIQRELEAGERENTTSTLIILFWLQKSGSLGFFKTWL